MQKKRTMLWVVAIVMLIAFAKSMPGIAAAGESEVAAGRKVYDKEGCIACHAIEGVGGRLGPDLTHIGSKKDEAWLKKQVTDPKAHFPHSVMPAFKRLSEKDLDHLADYLDSLK